MIIPAGDHTQAEMELEALLRASSTRDTLGAALMGHPDWLRSDVFMGLAALLTVAAAWLAEAEARA